MSFLENIGISYFKNTEESNTLIDNKQILKLANILNNIFNDDTFDIDIPKLVVIGTQSSGKSSLLNSIIGSDILPTGKSMVTRVPLNLELINGSKNYAEFGKYQSNVWIASKTIPFDYPTPLKEQQKQIMPVLHKKHLRKVSKRPKSNFNLVNQNGQLIENILMIYYKAYLQSKYVAPWSRKQSLTMQVIFENE